MDNDVYYKIYYSARNDFITIVCMQWFDEYDYVQERFLKDEDGEVLKFSNEEDAKAWLNVNIQEKKIDPEYKNGYEEETEDVGFDQKKFMKKKY